MVKQLEEIMFKLGDNKDEFLSREEMGKACNNSELNKLIEQVDFPYGFDFYSLFDMLDTNGNGYLARQEWNIGMLRVINSDPFQRDCVQAQEVGIIKHMLCDFREELRHEISLMQIKVDVILK